MEKNGRRGRKGMVGEPDQEPRWAMLRIIETEAGVEAFVNVWAIGEAIFVSGKSQTQ